MMKLSNKWQSSLPAKSRFYFRWSRNIFFILGILTLSYVSYALIDARFYQAEQARRFDQTLKETKVVRIESTTVPNIEIPVREGDPLGRIEISRVGLKAMVQEGIDEKTLRHAVGHIPGTSLPGQRGNVAMAGHRDTFFRELRNVRQDDEIILTTLNGSHSYRVKSTRVVEPEATEVLNAADEDILTLVTCYPFNFIGSAPQRFIVRAHKISR